MLRSLMERFADDPVEGAMTLFLLSLGTAIIGFIAICILAFAQWALFGGCPVPGQ